MHRDESTELADLEQSSTIYEPLPKESAFR